MTTIIAAQPIRVLVCGGRDYADRERLDCAMTPWLALFGAENLLIITGGARGADQMAQDWAARNDVAFKVYAANWEELGRRAGVIRNQLMLEVGAPHFCMAFPGGRGTADMVRRCRAAGVMTVELHT